MQLTRITSQTLGLIFVTAILASAQSIPDKGHPDALELLKNVEATYSAMGSYSAKATHVIEMNGANLQNKMEMSMAIAVDRSGRFRIDSTGMMGMLMVSDGSTVWVYTPQLNQYSKFSLGQAQASAQSQGALDQSEGDLDVRAEGGMAMLASVNPLHGYQSLGSNVKEAKLLRSEKVHVNGSEVDCWVISVEYESPASPTTGARAQKTAESPGFELAPTKTLWVDKTRYLVYQEESANKITMPGANEPINERDTTKFDSVSVDEPISPDVFTFTPPPGATEMDTSKEIERVKGQKKSAPN